MEGENIAIEWRDAQGKRNRLTEFAAELVHLKVDILVTAGGSATRSAKQTTTVIPVVMTQDRDPVANRFIASLARRTATLRAFPEWHRSLAEKRWSF